MGNLPQPVLGPHCGNSISWAGCRSTKQLPNLIVLPLTRNKLRIASKKKPGYTSIYTGSPCSTIISKCRSIWTRIVIDHWWKHLFEISLKALWNDENLRWFICYRPIRFISMCLSSSMFFQTGWNKFANYARTLLAIIWSHTIKRQQSTPMKTKLDLEFV